MADTTKTVKHIVLTGGVCGGKTSVLAYLEWELANHGITPILVPESARFIMEMGISPATTDPWFFQNAVMQMQVAHEELARKAAEEHPAEQIAILYDRAIMDNAAYSPHFLHLLNEYDLDPVSAREGRYDAVIHLVSAAIGAEQYYENDKSRHETLEEARELDLRTRDAWVGQEHFVVIDNSTDFEQKKHRALNAALGVFGYPEPLEIERKFLVHDWETLERLPLHAQTFAIEQVYPHSFSEGMEERFRRRGQNDSWVYYRTLKRKLRPGVRIERQSRIAAPVYAEARKRPGAFGVRKNRTCFLDDCLYFELDDFRPMGRNELMLEIELTQEDQEVVLPDWLGKCEEVTDDPSYSNRKIAIPMLELDTLNS